MEYTVGIILGLAIVAAARWIVFDRDRAFYPTVLIVIAAYYVLFAMMEASFQVLIFEIAAASGFLMAAIVGFRTRLWIVAVALIAHGVFDYSHHLFVDSPAVPDWWPGFCLAIDVTLGVWLGVFLTKRSNPVLEPTR